MIQLALTIAIIWAAEILVAFTVRILLPGDAGLTFTSA
jgi:hypothetical protein